MKLAHPLDRSVAFTILLDLSPAYADSTTDDGDLITEFLEDWYADPGLDMYAFGKVWVADLEEWARVSASSVDSRE